MSLISYITQIHFGYGSVDKLQDECDRLSIKRPLIVTDAGVRLAGIVDVILQKLNNPTNIGVFDKTPPNPNEHVIRDAVQVYRAGKHDGIIAVGGGSSIDLAKGVAVCSQHDGPLRSFALIEDGASRITAATAPVIAVPTTAGTGSEVGRGAILILDDGRKVGIISPHVVPKSAICDPALTVKLPPMLTAATGMDAIAHCIETFLSPSFNPPADGIALDGLRRGWANIEQATHDGNDLNARLNMMSASMQGALAFQKGLGCVHSLSHSLGGINPQLHHGTLNAIFLPAVVEFNRTASTVIQEDKLSRLAQAMAIDGANAVIPALEQMIKRLGLPTGLKQLGVTESQFEKIIDGALTDHSHKTNPREASRDDYSKMLASSI